MEVVKLYRYIKHQTSNKMIIRPSSTSDQIIGYLSKEAQLLKCQHTKTPRTCFAANKVSPHPHEQTFLRPENMIQSLPTSKDFLNRPVTIHQKRSQPTPNPSTEIGKRFDHGIRASKIVLVAHPAHVHNTQTKTPGIGALPILQAKDRVRRPLGITKKAHPGKTSQLLLHHLWTVILRGVAQYIGFVAWRLAAPVCIRSTVC